MPHPPKQRLLFLDGIRGWAALIVLIGHSAALTQITSASAFSIVHFLTHGQLAVEVFFVLSGFALSTRYFQTGKVEPFGPLVVRRYLRLTIPAFLTCILYYIALTNGWMVSLTSDAFPPDAWIKRFYHFSPTLGSLVYFPLVEMYLSPHNRFEASYNSNLWTMPIELWGSIGVFALIYLLSKNRYKRVFLYGVAFLLLIVLYCATSISMFPFLCGMLMADLFETSRFQQLRLSPKPLLYYSPVLLAAFVAACYSPYPPPIVLCVIAVCMLLGFAINEKLSHFFENRVSRFLGRISFSLYLLHHLVIGTFSVWLYGRMLDTGYGLLETKMAVAVITIVTSLIVAYAFSPIEKQSQRWARIITQRLMNRRR